MNPHAESGAPVRLLDTILSVMRWLLYLITPVVILFSVLLAFGVASASIHGVTDEPVPVRLNPGEYTVDRNGETVDVAETNTFESPDGTVRFEQTEVEFDIGDGATAVRATVGAIMLSWLALGWLAITNLHALVRATRNGDAFTAQGVRQLTRVGLACLAYPVVTGIGQVVLGTLVGQLRLAGPAVSVRIPLGDWWAWVIAGFLLLVVSRVFEQGVDLRELEETTV